MFKLFLLSMIPASAGVFGYVVWRLTGGGKPSVIPYYPVRHSVVSIDELPYDVYHLDVEHYDAKGEYRRQQYRGAPGIPYLLYPQGVRLEGKELIDWLDAYVHQYLWSQENKEE